MVREWHLDSPRTVGDRPFQQMYRLVIQIPRRGWMASDSTGRQGWLLDVFAISARKSVWNHTKKAFVENAGHMKIRAIAENDYDAWTLLWNVYIAYHDVILPDAVTTSVWTRLHDPDIQLFGLVAVDSRGEVFGFAHYVIHQNTWNESCICYLEDLCVAEDRRGKGTGLALIEHLADLSRANGWRRLYWHAMRDNSSARGLYDRVANLSNYVRYDYKF